MAQTQRLSQWAKDNDYSYGGALKLYHRGGIPGAYQHPETKTIRVPINQHSQKDESTPPKVALYARVSTRKQQPHLETQLERLREYANANGYVIVQEVTEIASGMNDKRKKLNKLLQDDSWDILLVEYKDRLARFGTQWIHMLAANNNQKIMYINTTTEGDEESLVEDITSV